MHMRRAVQVSGEMSYNRSENKKFENSNRRKKRVYSQSVSGVDARTPTPNENGIRVLF